MPGILTGIAAAAAASTLYAGGIALQALEARQAPVEQALRLSLFRRLVGRPLWLGGTALGLAGWVLQTVALTRAPLTLVQPLLGLSLVLLLGLAVWRLGEHVARGDAAAALALYRDDAIVQYGGLCWTPCVGRAAIRKELERRVAAKNEWKVIGKYVSGNVAVLQTELKIGYIESSGVDRVVVWNIYEVRGPKIAVATLVGQRTDPQTAQFIKWFSAQPKSQ
jgi:hypothetical protein